MNEKIKDDLVSNVYHYIVQDKFIMALDTIEEIGLDYFSHSQNFIITITSYCIEHNKHKFLEKLVSLGLDVNIKDSSGRHALFFCNSVDDIHLLNKHGIKLNEKNNFKQTVLDYLIIDAHYGKGFNVEEKIKTLISLGAKYRKKDLKLLPAKMYNEVKELIDNLELKKQLDKELSLSNTVSKRKIKV